MNSNKHISNILLVGLYEKACTPIEEETIRKHCENCSECRTKLEKFSPHGLDSEYAAIRFYKDIFFSEESQDTCIIVDVLMDDCLSVGYGDSTEMAADSKDPFTIDHWKERFSSSYLKVKEENLYSKLLDFVKNLRIAISRNESQLYILLMSVSIEEIKAYVKKIIIGGRYTFDIQEMQSNGTLYIGTFDQYFVEDFTKMQIALKTQEKE